MIIVLRCVHKKIISIGIFIAVMAIGTGVTYYCYPSGINTISDSNLLTADSAASSLATIDPNAGIDNAAADVRHANGDALRGCNIILRTRENTGGVGGRYSHHRRLGRQQTSRRVSISFVCN